MKTELNFAVLVDAENMPASDYIAVLNEVEANGAVAIKWIYADWTNQHQKNWKEALHETASKPKQQFHYGKDAADHALVMDAIEITNNNHRINAVCIVSSDGGFSSVAQRIREYGIHVMAIGNRNTPERFRKACHNFVFIDNLSHEVEKNPSDLDSLLLSAYHRCSDKNEPVYLGDMGTMIKQIDSSFDPRSEGFSSLKKLLRDKDSIFSIVGETNDRCFILLKSKSDAEKQELFTGKIRKWEPKRKFGFIKSDTGDFHFNTNELISSEHQIKVGTKVSFNADLSVKKQILKSKESPSAFNVALA